MLYDDRLGDAELRDRFARNKRFVYERFLRWCNVVQPNLHFPAAMYWAFCEQPTTLLTQENPDPWLVFDVPNEFAVRFISANWHYVYRTISTGPQGVGIEEAVSDALRRMNLEYSVEFATLEDFWTWFAWRRGTNWIWSDEIGRDRIFNRDGTLRTECVIPYIRGEWYVSQWPAL